MANKPTVDILLATYNGEEYIRTQIDSIIKQTYENWKIIVRDDGSTDRTVEIVEEYMSRYPDKFEIVTDSDKNLGPSGNFSRLLESSTANYIMFCDQDDYWKETKVEKTLNKMLNVENGEERAVLVHSDLEVVDRDLNTIANSMFDFQKLNKNFTSINELLVQNNVTGCTMMINKKLKEIAQPIPLKGIIMHDYWLALVAATFGKIAFLDEATIKYRQHGKNDVGAKRYSSDMLRKAMAVEKMKDAVEKSIQQAKTFYNHYQSQLDEKTKEIVHAYISLSEKNPLKRILVTNRYQFKKQGMIRNLGFKFIITKIK